MNTIKVIVVDDSAVVRQVASEALRRVPDIEVIAAVSDPLFALERMRHQWPDVIVLDVEMPRMDGLTFLRKIMAERPTPTIICSSLTERGARTTMDALAAGAVEIITKPRMGVKDFLVGAGDDLVRAVRAAARANLRRLGGPVVPPPPRLNADAVLAARTAARSAMHETTDRVVAIGTSTGGTQALEAVLSRLPAVSPGMVVVQHMPEKFTALFAQRLDTVCAVEVREAVSGDRVMPGRVLIAPGGRHMLLRRSGAQYRVEVVDGPLVNRHRPSVDVLFRSVAQVAGRNALGIIMTGMGDDGARGLKEMHEAGARTIAEAESSCVVFGMPKEAIRLGAADKVLPLERIGAEIVAFHTP
ncbi:chemotaxis response regulator protein-glutamate methylesterase [Nitrogeniibacter mangrovi]|uniref:Protein-glutamate methylesterase/protein-glutamine glutaminase n=1 Tax=Nitrogeniibacter mangrovi TaxID=2016596 RepID=A0A6C1B1W2_9RHOO|nr:chemotaxis response regulator protein-glutamate methylesterase [Nitrogeniibacter mangrovi]QID16808.1 chemotaxis response regulator protein-glutamate methylesterase [Nitrogeniibacter mangrovi]